MILNGRIWRGHSEPRAFQKEFGPTRRKSDLGKKQSSIRSCGSLLKHECGSRLRSKTTTCCHGFHRFARICRGDFDKESRKPRRAYRVRLRNGCDGWEKLKLFENAFFGGWQSVRLVARAPVVIGRGPRNAVTRCVGFSVIHPSAFRLHPCDDFLKIDAGAPSTLVC